MKRQWGMPIISLLLGISVLGLAVIDYQESPADHKGISLGPVFLPIEFNKAPTASNPNQRTPGPTSNPGGGPSPTPGASPSAKPSAPPAPKRFVYAFSASGNPTAVVKGLPSYVAGVSWIVAWRDVEPAGPVNGVHTYNWSRIDNALAAAAASGRKSMVRVIAGEFSPSWVQPTVTFTTTLGGPAGTVTVTMPVTYSSSFLNNWTAFIRAYGKRYNGDSRIYAIQMAGAGIQGEMTMGGWRGWTSTAPPPTGMGSNPASDQIMINTWNTIVDTYRQAFPSKHTALDLGEPLNDGKIMQPVLQHASIYGTMVYFQNNGLRSGMGTVYPGLLGSTSARTTIGWQMWGGNNSPSALLGALQIAVNSHATYVEVYQNDCDNAADASAIQWFLSH